MLLVLTVLSICHLADTSSDAVKKGGPFRSRAPASSYLVGGYLAAIERQHRRFSRSRNDVQALLRKLGNDFNADLMSVDKPSLNATRIVSRHLLSYRHIDPPHSP